MGISFSMSDVAKITGLHKNTIRNYIQRGELKGKKVAPTGTEPGASGRSVVAQRHP